MIPGHDRLILVVGMPHSGTTILTYLLRQHPDVFLYTDGKEAWLLENDLVPSEQTEQIQALLHRHPGKRVLLKRPWAECRHEDWLCREMPAAYYLYCLKPFPVIATSWSAARANVEPRINRGGMPYQHAVYQVSLKRALRFAEQVPHFRTVCHADLLADPAVTTKKIEEWLGLPPFRWDLSKMSSDTNIKDILKPTGASASSGTSCGPPSCP